jgi:hypothetical protein
MADETQTPVGHRKCRAHGWICFELYFVAGFVVAEQRPALGSNGTLICGISRHWGGTPDTGLCSARTSQATSFTQSELPDGDGSVRLRSCHPRRSGTFFRHLPAWAGRVNGTRNLLDSKTFQSF